MPSKCAIVFIVSQLQPSGFYNLSSKNQILHQSRSNFIQPNMRYLKFQPMFPASINSTKSILNHESHQVSFQLPDPSGLPSIVPREQRAEWLNLTFSDFVQDHQAEGWGQWILVSLDDRLKAIRASWDGCCSDWRPQHEG